MSDEQTTEQPVQEQPSPEMQKMMLLSAVSHNVSQRTGVQLSPKDVETLLLEVQREQLKRVVYQAYIEVTQPEGNPSEDNETGGVE